MVGKNYEFGYFLGLGINAIFIEVEINLYK